MPGSGQALTMSSKPTRKAVAMRFGILGPAEIEAMAAVEIESESLVEKDAEGRSVPSAKGLCDRRMGTTERDARCATCGCDSTECPGHFGALKLAKPVYHPGYVEWIRKVLDCVCDKCGRLLNADLIDPQSALFREIRGHNNRTRFRKVRELCKKNSRRCAGPERGGCGTAQPTYKAGKGLKIEVDERREKDAGSGADSRRVLQPEEAEAILKRIPEEDCKTLGLHQKWARPEWMVIRTLPVAPPPVRPSVTEGGGRRSEDDLTYAYKEVVKYNIMVAREDGRPDIQKELVDILQGRVAAVMTGSVAGAAQARHTGGKPVKDIRSRLKGKEGRVRGNLMGKRVDFSARTVITPDPILQLDQLGVPEDIAKNLTVPEHVTSENIEYMEKLVRNGPRQWPGAKYIIQADGTKKDLAAVPQAADRHLLRGYIVERQLRDGDYVVFNRQPSLHRMSLMGHRVKVLPSKTFRLNLSVTAPYNADFDGDEMNMHVPQSYETKAEVKEIMAVPNQVVAPKDNKPVMGLVQDALLGISLFTHKDAFLELDQTMNLLMWLDYAGTLPPPAILRPRPLWTGKQLLSLVIPDVNYAKDEEKLGKAMDKCVVVKKGELHCGQIMKAHVGNQPSGLVHIVWKDLGPEACKLFLSNMQNLVNNWLVNNGFTVGVQDIIAAPATNVTIQNALNKHKRQVQRIVQRTQRGKLEKKAGLGMQERFEAQINEALNTARGQAGDLAHSDLEPWNRLSNMVSCGSKGSTSNISQIMACVGQQNVEGKRIAFGFNRRSLPHFSKDDFGPESKGFVTNCYVYGLTPTEFYFHAMGGREGLIDTACKTAETGYIQRRLIKALEDVQIKYDATVRTSRDTVLQFIYGEDGMDAQRIESMKVALVQMDNAELAKHAQFFEEGTDDIAEMRKKLRDVLTEDAVAAATDDEVREMADLLEQEFETLKEDREALRSTILPSAEPGIHLPVNVERLIKNLKVRQESNIQKTDLRPDVVIKKTRELCDRIQVYQQPRLAHSELFTEASKNATQLFKIYLRQLLVAKHVIEKWGLTQSSFELLVGDIETKFRQGLVHPGEMVGCIGAQSMGEPATQMTLNTFHNAGIASKNVTLGVPRLKEVINVASNLKTPSIKICLPPEDAADEEAARKIINLIEYTTLSQVVASSAIFYDADPAVTIIQADQELLDRVAMTDDQAGGTQKSPWLFRFELDTEKLTGRDLPIHTIEDRLRAELEADDAKEGDELDIIYHQDLERGVLGKQVLRMRVPDMQGEGDSSSATAVKKTEDWLLTGVGLKGIPNITQVSHSDNQKEKGKKKYGPDGKEVENKDKNWILETDGLALKEILAVDNVDYSRTISNSVKEVLQVLGVEAARQSLLHELGFVLGSYSIYVNYRHLSTLCDVMTTRGILTAVTRHGINRVDSGALRKCSFEETLEILLEASFHAELDPLCGVTENIIMGQLAPYGTGAFDVMMDVSQVKDFAVGTGRAGQPDPPGHGGLDESGQFGGGAAVPGTPGFQTPSDYCGANNGGMTTGQQIGGWGGDFTPDAHRVAGPNPTSMAYQYPGPSPRHPAIPINTPGIRPPGGPGASSPGYRGFIGVNTAREGFSPAYRGPGAGQSPAHPGSPSYPGYQRPGLGGTTPAYSALGRGSSPRYVGMGGSYSPRYAPQQSPAPQRAGPSYPPTMQMGQRGPTWGAREVCQNCGKSKGGPAGDANTCGCPE